MSENICLDCGKEVGNNVFTICDGCWDKRDMIKLQNRIKQLERELETQLQQAIDYGDKCEQLEQEIKGYIRTGTLPEQLSELSDARKKIAQLEQALDEIIQKYDDLEWAEGAVNVPTLMTLFDEIECAKQARKK